MRVVMPFGVSGASGGGWFSDQSPCVERVANDLNAGFARWPGRRSEAEGKSCGTGQCLSGAAAFGPLMSP